MNPALFYLLKVVLCSGALYAYYVLALRNRLYHQWNRFYLLAAVLFSLLFPLIPLPSLYNTATDNNLSLALLLPATSADAVVTGAKRQAWNGETFAWAFYLLVTFVSGLRLSLGFLQIRRLLKHAPVQILGPVAFVLTDHPSAPFSFFSWLFWKKEVELESEGGQSIFRHELVHIREKHSVDKLLLQVVLVLFWINPFFWLIRRELHLIHEFIADKKAVGNGGSDALAAMILQSVYGKKYNQLINPFFQQPVKRRLAMLQKTLNQPRNAYLGRLLSLPLFALLLFAFAKKEVPDFNRQPVNTINSFSALDTLPAKQQKPALDENIREVRVNKKDSGSTITIIYKDGKQETLTQQEAIAKGLLSPPPPPPPLDPKALVVIDGKTRGTMEQVGNLDKLVPAENIELVNVLKEAHATEKYGTKGAAGVIEISTRAASEPNRLFEKVEQAPSFPGGQTAWQQFLQKNLNPVVPVEKGAPAGSYTTITEFKVAADGTISDFKPLTTHGYGMEEAVLALMEKSPKWEPAQQNGKKVNALHQQKVTFVIADEENESKKEGVALRQNAPGTDPLVIVDGVIKGSGKAVLESIKLENIESVNVLKDQSALSKYGEKAMHGAIEITTKKPK